MISPKHRADVVGRLRALAAVCDEDMTDGAFLDILYSAILDHDEPKSDACFFDALADLIERKTTSWHSQYTDDARPTYLWCLCDHCKTPIGHMQWNYCPKCGAEIVR